MTCARAPRGRRRPARPGSACGSVRSRPRQLPGQKVDPEVASMERGAASPASNRAHPDCDGARSSWLSLGHCDQGRSPYRHRPRLVHRTALRQAPRAVRRTARARACVGTAAAARVTLRRPLFPAENAGRGACADATTAGSRAARGADAGQREGCAGADGDGRHGRGSRPGTRLVNKCNVGPQRAAPRRFRPAPAPHRANLARRASTPRAKVSRLVSRAAATASADCARAASARPSPLRFRPARRPTPRPSPR